MSNLLITQKTNTDNKIAASKIGSSTQKSRDVEAPQYLPKYSIDKVLREKDEFRRNITQQQNEKLYKKKNNFLLKLGVIFAAVGGFFLLKGKK